MSIDVGDEDPTLLVYSVLCVTCYGVLVTPSGVREVRSDTWGWGNPSWVEVAHAERPRADRHAFLRL